MEDSTISVVLDNDVEINITGGTINNLKTGHEEFIPKYLKTRYLTNYERFNEHFLNKALSAMKSTNNFSDFYVLKNIVKMFCEIEPFDFITASKVEDTALRGIAFSEVSIEEIISKCGGKRIQTEGIELPQRFYNMDGSYNIKNLSLIYELYEVNLDALSEGNRGSIGKSYAVKAWCTSTNKAVFLWVRDEDAKKGPLHAIASLCRVWENVLNAENVTLKRHGDIFLFETSEEVDCSGEIVSLDKDTYFRLLCAQT